MKTSHATLITALCLAVTACSNSRGLTPAPPTASPTPFSVLAGLHTQTTIGSTVDTGFGTGNGDQNPYGLAIAPSTSGKITQGDLIICNFNNAANVQGTGTTIEGLHPTAGSAPYRIAQDMSLTGCDALTLDPKDNIYNAAYATNLDPIFSSSGTLITTNANPVWSGPFGEIYSATSGTYGAASVFASNANSGTIVRLDLNSSGALSAIDTIISGFTKNTGVPGSILGASGLTYNPSGDILYVVDGGNNRLVAFSGVTTLAPNSITVSGTGFTGPSASAARVVYSGSPLNAPVSAALLVNGNVVVGNTADNNMIEISPGGAVMDKLDVDTGAVGAIFGIVTSGTTPASQKIYFNDDNAATVVLISQ
jgi:hypothetical protein